MERAVDHAESHARLAVEVVVHSVTDLVVDQVGERGDARAATARGVEVDPRAVPVGVAEARDLDVALVVMRPEGVDDAGHPQEHRDA